MMMMDCGNFDDSLEENDDDDDDLQNNCLTTKHTVCKIKKI